MIEPASNIAYSDLSRLVRQRLLLDSQAHLVSREHVLQRRDQNWMHTLDKLDSVTRDFWFGDHTVTSPEHLGVVPETTTDRWLNNQLSDPPYGVLESGEYLVTSSGSTGPVKLFPYRQDDWWKTLACTARGMLALGMDHDDVFLTTALGTMQAGFRVMEEAAQLVIGARVIIERSSSLKRKLERIRDHGVTVFMSTPSKLHRLADMEPRKYFTRQPRAIISTGGHITDKQRLMDAFGVDDIYDIYGSSEIGQIMWTCRHGHQHFNEDFTHMTYRDGRSFFTNIWTLPIFNNDLGDYISYSYKGRCECGSYLATVDEFRAKPRIAAK